MKSCTARRCGVACLWAVAAVALAQAPASVAQAGTEASTTFQRWDRNSDNSLSGAEFAAGWQEIQTANALRNLHDNFVVKDVDRSGGLGPSEYAKLDLIRKVGISAPPMAKFDTDKNQSLDFREYVGLVGALALPRP